jgi:hypothetical protein
MKGIEAHFTAKLSKDAESRTTKTGKAMTVLTTVVSDSGDDGATWCTVLAFEDLAERLAGLPKGTVVVRRGIQRLTGLTPFPVHDRASSRRRRRPVHLPASPGRAAHRTNQWVRVDK